MIPAVYGKARSHTVTGFSIIFASSSAEGLFIINSGIMRAENSRIDLLLHKYKASYDQHCHT